MFTDPIVKELHHVIERPLLARLQTYFMEAGEAG